MSKRLTVALVGGCAALLLAADIHAADPRTDTAVSWDTHVAALERRIDSEPAGPPLGSPPQGHTDALRDGAVHTWRGSVLIDRVTVPALVDALSNPGLPPPAPDILEARVLRRTAGGVHLFVRFTRRAIVTVTYDTEHDVSFTRRSPTFATSRSVSTSIRETGGADRGFLWRLNSYWSYRQRPEGTEVDLVSVSLSRTVPFVLRPLASPVIEHIARESVASALEAVRRFGSALAS